MKKILFLLITMLPGIVMAEDVVQVLPFNAPVGLTENDYDEEHVMQLYMTNTNAYTAMQLDIYLPEGLSLQLDEQAWDFNPDRFDGITKRGIFTPYHDIDLSQKDDVPGHYLLLLYDTDLSVIKGEEGVLIDFYYLTSEDMQPGIYPIIVSGTVLTVDSHNDVRPGTSVSYVKIGEPEKNVVYDLGEGIVPSFVESEMTGVENVVLNGECKNFVLTDGSDYSSSLTFTAEAASYERALSAEWGTVCLPFALESDNEVQYYKLVAVSETTMTFEPVASVEAGEPAVFKSLSGDGLAIHASNVSVANGGKEKVQEAEGWTMKGTYVAFNNDPAACENDIYYIAEDKFWYANMEFAVAAFRGWFETAKNAAGAQRYSIVETEGLTNGVEYVEQEDGSVKVIFDLQGRRMNDAQKGNVNIVNGKTVIVK